jgi:hypothetical protein
VEGVWRERVVHTSNYHETMAVFLVLKHFVAVGKMTGVRIVRLWTDNTTVMFNVNKLRGASTLLHPLKLIARFLNLHRMEMKAVHLPGIDNGTADSLSRLARSGDYSLDPIVYRTAVDYLGVLPQVDLFANKTNCKCQRYVTLEQDGEALARDAFSLVWRDFFFFIHPPVPLILRCVRKIIQEGTRGVIVLPAWQGQVWSVLLQRITIQQVTLGKSTEVLHPGPRMLQAGTQLPPGTLLMCRVDGSIN